MEISNLGFAAFLILRNHPLVENPSRDDKKMIFKFNLTEDEYKELYRIYINSELSSFDRIITHLKKLLPRY